MFGAKVADDSTTIEGGFTAVGNPDPGRFELHLSGDGK